METYWQAISKSIRDFLWPGPTPAQKTAAELIDRIRHRPAVPLSSLQTHQMHDAVIAWHRHKTIDAGTAEKFLDLIEEIDRLRKLLSRANMKNIRGQQQ